jgi:ketosteroid isomerase-like protein
MPNTSPDWTAVIATLEAAEREVEMRATMVFRREAGKWRIVHRHADSQMATEAPQ